MIYLKIENNRPTEAPLNFQAETGLILNFNKSPETMVQYGFLPCNENDYFDYKAGKKLIVDNQFVENPNWEQQQEVKEQERINTLTMTRLDFRNFLKSNGLTRSEIDTYLLANPDIKEELDYCQDVYCGRAKALMPITLGEITITAEIVENAFRVKNGEVIE